jgi:hypothetical protein
MSRGRPKVGIQDEERERKVAFMYEGTGDRRTASAEVQTLISLVGEERFGGGIGPRFIIQLMRQAWTAPAANKEADKSHHNIEGEAADCKHQMQNRSAGEVDVKRLSRGGHDATVYQPP